MRVRPSSPRGFTLLEILVALVIFVGAIGVLSRLIMLGLDNAEFAQLQAEGVLLIENRFAELDAGILEASDSGAMTDESFPNWIYELGVEKTADFLYRITAAAKHNSGVNVSIARLYFDEKEAEEALSPASSSSSSTSSSSGGGS